MSCGNLFIKLLMLVFIAHTQARPLFFNAFQDYDDGFGGGFADYFIDVDTARTPVIHVNPFVLPINNETEAELLADDDVDSTYDILETPAVYAENFEHAFDEAAGRLENILRLAVRKFKESFIHSFEIITNSSANADNALSSSTTVVGGDKEIANNATDVNKNKENENEIKTNETDNTAVSENTNKIVNMMAVDGTTNKHTVDEVQSTVDQNEATNTVTVDKEAKPDIVGINETDAKAENQMKPDTEIKVDNSEPNENEMKIDNDLKPSESEVMPSIEKVETEAPVINENTKTE